MCVRACNPDLQINSDILITTDLKQKMYVINKKRVFIWRPNL